MASREDAAAANAARAADSASARASRIKASASARAASRLARLAATAASRASESRPEAASSAAARISKARRLAASIVDRAWFSACTTRSTISRTFTSSLRLPLWGEGARSKGSGRLVERNEHRFIPIYIKCTDPLKFRMGYPKPSPDTGTKPRDTRKAFTCLACSYYKEFPIDKTTLAILLLGIQLQAHGHKGSYQFQPLTE